MRNINTRFSYNPTTVDISRSTFEQKWSHLTTMSAGKLYPIAAQEILPGDTFSLDTSVLARMATPIFPVMDDCYIDTYHFFVPNRLVWEHWKNLMGENDESPWASSTEYSVPQLTLTKENFENSNADYFGIGNAFYTINSYGERVENPFAGDSIKVNVLPFRALALIWNEWFRDQNVMSPKGFNKGDDGSVDDTQGLLDLYNVAKYHDYFTSALPAPQKGSPVQIPLLGDAPLSVGSSLSDISGFSFKTSEGVMLDYANVLLGVENYDGEGGLVKFLDVSDYENSERFSPVGRTNLVADLSQVTGATINQLRQAFQIQKMFERDARGGTRYVEQIRAAFGVISPDARMQRPEYLGGRRTVINMTQVVQTSASDNASPQGNTAAYSLTRSVGSDYTKSFTEHGFVISVACVRTHQSYQQGINRMWSRRSRLDYYDPLFANLGEQAILNKEIYAQGSDVDDEVFGYQEAWAEYRYTPSVVSGAFRSDYSGGSLDSWHYSNYFDVLPRLSEGFISETDVNIDRTLAVESELAPQFIVGISFKNMATRKMPLYSVPGLIDHH